MAVLVLVPFCCLVKMQDDSYSRHLPNNLLMEISWSLSEEGKHRLRGAVAKARKKKAIHNIPGRCRPST